MASVDLTISYRRLDWADTHAGRVRDLSAEWAATAMVTTATTDRDRGAQMFRAQVIGESRSRFALALGDVLHHAWAALDNLLGVLRGGATDHSAFRINTDPNVFDRDGQRRLAGVPDWAGIVAAAGSLIVMPAT